MSTLFNMCGEQFVDYSSEIYYLIQHSINIDDLKIKQESINLFASVIEGLTSSQNKIYRNLFNDILINFKVILDSNDEILIKESINCFIDLAEVEPNIFSKNLNDILVLT